MSAVGTGLALAGTLLIALAGVGILRLPDVYGRLNAAAKAAGLGIVLVLLGDLVTAASWSTAVKIVLAIVLQLATVPVGSYALGRAAYRSRAPLWHGTRYDELADRSATDGPAAVHSRGHSRDAPSGERRT